jgi:rRNA maturation RNase YbeY
MIRFYVHEIDFRLLDQRNLKAWIANTIEQATFHIEALNYIFCSDDYLLEINKQHLQHDYYTDIITFDYSANPKELEGEFYISIDRIRDNAAENHVSFAEELHRVMIHGVLHLLGHGDKSATEAKEMRRLENEALQARMFHVKQYAK